MVKLLSEPGASPSAGPSTELFAATWVRLSKETSTVCGELAPFERVRVIVPSGGGPAGLNAPLAGSKVRLPLPETLTPLSVVLAAHDQVSFALLVLVKVTVIWWSRPSESNRLTVDVTWLAGAAAVASIR